MEPKWHTKTYEKKNITKPTCLFFGPTGHPLQLPAHTGYCIEVEELTQAGGREERRMAEDTQDSNLEASTEAVSSEITELVSLTQAFSQSEPLILIICYFAI